MKWLRITILVLLSCGSAIAQDDLRVIKPVAPVAYPPAARAVHAQGDVLVEVIIAPSGKVTSSSGFVGHPLLRGAAEKAAAEWEFSAVPKRTGARTAILTFHFKVDGFRLVDESEKDEENVLNSSFPSIFEADLVNETIVPRLLLLPSENGVVKRNICPLHKEVMSVEVQSAICAYDGSDRDFERSEQYNEAEDAEFPNANPADTRGCRTDGIEKVEVYYCQACRIARSNWLQINK